MFISWLGSKRRLIPILGVTALVLSAGTAWAQEVEYLSQASANILWTLVAAILVMFMQTGFAMVECGFTRAKNAGNILMKNFLDYSAGSIAFFLFGFAFMFGTDISGIIGMSGFTLGDSVGTDPSGQWNLTFWFFQSVFAATGATIVSGAMAERTKFISYIIVSILVTGVIYPISGHWCWGNLWLGDAGGGWLAEIGFADFAGSTVVHSVGGWVGLAGAIVLGSRRGKYNTDGTPRAIPGHNIPLAALGVFILWFGWFGFNPGSTTVANGDVGYIAVNTSLAACAGMLSAMIFTWMRFGKPDPSMSMNGALAGLVAITAGCYELSPMGALVTGLIAGVLVVLSVVFLDRVLKIDDPVGAVSVHGVCGAWGTLAVGLFASPDFGSISGLLYGGGFSQLFIQLIGVVAVFIWAFGMGLVVMKIVRSTTGLRVSEEEEMRGLDIVEHGSEGYNGFQIFTVE